ncbi:dUTPase domain-containing protein [Ceratobasidium sp. AG-Ba]|nr:dUTPase domain-containing protein [Ceratobasidium sp. AG-Ba]
MPQENTFDLNIAHTSPLFTATPLTGNRSTGWETRCTADGYVCDAPNQSAVYTAMPGATMELKFWGSRIELAGVLTGGMELTWELDGSSRSPDSGATSLESDDSVGQKLGGGLLGVFSGLDSSHEHTLRFTAKPSLSSAMLAFEGAIVTVGTGVVGGQMSRTYLDIDNPAYNITLPPGVVDPQFESTKLPGSSVSLTFNGTQVLLYGPCYASNGAYTITLDNEPAVVYNASLNAYSAPPAAPVAASCLRYISPPLSPDKPHLVSMANNDQGRETNLDWVLVVGNSGGLAVEKSKKGSNVGAIVGAVVGSLALVLALVVLFFLIRRRRQKGKKIRPASDLVSGEKGVPLDLLLAQSNVPSLTSEHKPNVLVNPSHGSNASSGNERTYRNIEPFELPPVVDGVRSHGKTPSAGAEVANSGERQSSSLPLNSVSSLPQDATIERAPPAPVSMRTASPPPTSATSQSVSSAPFSHADPPLVQPYPLPNQVPGQAAPAPDLSQISSDVNRILAQLGQIRRRTDSNVREQEEESQTQPPPEYGKHRRI